MPRVLSDAMDPTYPVPPPPPPPPPKSVCYSVDYQFHKVSLVPRGNLSLYEHAWIFFEEWALYIVARMKENNPRGCLEFQSLVCNPCSYATSHFTKRCSMWPRFEFYH